MLSPWSRVLLHPLFLLLEEKTAACECSNVSGVIGAFSLVVNGLIRYSELTRGYLCRYPLQNQELLHGVKTSL